MGRQKKAHRKTVRSGEKHTGLSTDAEKKSLMAHSSWQLSCVCEAFAGEVSEGSCSDTLRRGWQFIGDHMLSLLRLAFDNLVLQSEIQFIPKTKVKI